jgi:CheY-like chemotaxis protein
MTLSFCGGHDETSWEIADDNKAMRDILTSMLGAEFDVIRAVSDGDAALAATTQLLPDVAILDFCMPVLNGIEVARRIRDTGTNVAVVFLAACSDFDNFSCGQGNWVLGVCA